MSADAANHGTGRDSRNLTPAGIGQSFQQGTPKGRFLIAPGSCNGPTGPCALEIGHPGDHWRLRRGDLPIIDVHDCSICRRVHGNEVKHASE